MLSKINGDSGADNGHGTGSGNGDSGSKKVKGVFSYISDSFVKTTIDMINNNYPSKRIDKINIYLDALGKSQHASDYIDTTIWQLDNIKNYMSHFSWYITTYTNRIKWYLIPRLDRLNSSEHTISRINNNGNGLGIKSTYEEIKHKVRYCKSSLEFEKERLESISKNARMLQKQLEFLISMIKKNDSNVKKLEGFKTKLETLKRNKNRSMNYLKWLVRSIVANLCKIQKISNSLNSANDEVSIATIKGDIENINSSIKEINNIVPLVKLYSESLVGLKLEIDCGTVNDVECCIKEIVCDIHKKYCCLISDIKSIFTDQPCQVQTLAENCKLSEIVKCTCTTQPSSETCESCQVSQCAQGCPSCECLKQLLAKSSESNIKEKLDCIKKIICKLIDGKRADGCQETQQQQCSNVCQTSQAQTTSTCQTTIPGEKNNSTCKETNIRQLIKSTLEEITKCQQSSKVTDSCKDEVKCPDTPDKTCQISSVAQPATSCSTTTASSVVKCNELDKVKLCVDTMINKCNCPQLKQMLKELVKDGNLKCIDVFKWLIISNFRELFCLYVSFDRSILNEISCLTENLQQMKFDSGGMISIYNRIKILDYLVF